ncbi:MAG: hypothetical protein JXR77_11060 [Lentisphaeria bacterium]|nr:hypothetical protein [Lentisphaeria bacterium]
MTERERRLAAVRFRYPDRIPVAMDFTGDCWERHGSAALDRIMADHPRLWPGHRPKPPGWRPTHAPWRRAGVPYTDSWGCLWETIADGTTGAVVRHPLADWSAFEGFGPPDPAAQDGWGAIDWEVRKAALRAARESGRLAAGGLRHGHLFLTLTYLRGFENLLFDMADEEPRLGDLVAMIEAFSAEHVRRWLALGVEWLGYPEDLGMQVGPMLSPAQFRRWIQPSYQRLMAPAKDRGVVVHMHCDGDVRDLAEDLLDCGVDVLNIQDEVNGIDWMRENLRGRVAIHLDIDRQHIPVHGRPRDIEAHIRRVVSELADPRGGLLLHASVGPSVPLENAAALATALENSCEWP